MKTLDGKTVANMPKFGDVTKNFDFSYIFIKNFGFYNNFIKLWDKISEIYQNLNFK